MILRNPPSPRLRWPAALAVAALAAAVLPWSPTLADDQPLPPVAASEPPDAPARPTPTLRFARPVEPLPPRKPARVVETARPLAVHFTSEDANQLKDELELLVAQRETKQAMVRVAEADLKTATVKLANTTRLASQNVVSKQEVDLYRNAATSAEAQLAVRKAELKEQDVKIAQAKRRLDRATAARSGTTLGYRVVPTRTRLIYDAADPNGPADKRVPEDVRATLKQVQASMDSLILQQLQLANERQTAQAALENLKIKETKLNTEMLALQAVQQKILDALKTKGPNLPKP